MIFMAVKTIRMVQFLKVSGFPISADCSDDTSVVDKVDNYKSDLRFTT